MKNVRVQNPKGKKSARSMTVVVNVDDLKVHPRHLHRRRTLRLKVTPIARGNPTNRRKAKERSRKVPSGDINPESPTVAPGRSTRTRRRKNGKEVRVLPLQIRLK